MRRSIALPSILLTAFLLAGQLQVLRAAIILNGDVDPNDADDWDTGTSGYVGKTGFGTLDVNDGSDLYSYEGYLGNTYSSTGVAMVEGAGSTWTNTTSLYAGNAGIGILRITDGGNVSDSSGYVGCNSGSTGTVVVDGAGSTWANGSDLRVGLSGAGTLSIADGGTVSDSVGYIGCNSGSTGVVTINGAGATWSNTSDLYVGHSGRGTLKIANGGAVSNSGGHIGYESGSTGFATVDGPATVWTDDSNLYVGESGTGTLSMTNGAVVNCHYGFTGYSADSNGLAIVDGIGSTWESDRRYIGRSGSGSMHVVNGGMMGQPERALLCVIGDQPNSTGDVTVDGAGSAMSGVGGLIVGNSGSGTLNISNGGTVDPCHFVNDWEREWVGFGTGSTGFVSIAGIGSQWTTGYSLVVGYEGTGTVRVSDGGQLVTNVYGPSYAIDYSCIGYDRDSTGTVIVDGPGSQWTAKRGFTVGHEGNGILTITNGGNVSGGYYIARERGSTGVVTVDGAGSTWTASGGLFVGNGGNATLRITNGGLVVVPLVTYLTRDWKVLGTLDFGSAGGGRAANQDALGASELRDGQRQDHYQGPD